MAKFDFWKVYQGPRGPHLSQLTKYTVSKERKETGSMKPGKHLHQVVLASSELPNRTPSPSTRV
jgi:hypothetical protein